MSYYTNSSALWPWCGSGGCTEAAGVVHVGHRGVVSPANQRLLADPYKAMARFVRWPALSVAQGFPHLTLRPLRINLGVPPASEVSRRAAAVRAASALHELTQAEAAFDNTTLAAGGAYEIHTTMGSGKTQAFIYLVGHLARTGLWRSSYDVLDVERSLPTLLLEAGLSSGRSPLDFLIGHFRDALGLNRASSRNLRAVLLLLVGLRCLVLAWHRDRLDAVGSKGRAYLRTALTGASTRNAPPLAGVVRRSGTTGARNLPPMQLAA